MFDREREDRERERERERERKRERESSVRLSKGVDGSLPTLSENL